MLITVNLDCLKIKKKTKLQVFNSKIYFFVFYKNVIMLHKLIEWDKELFLYLNDKNIVWLDPVMLFLSSYVDWILICLLMAFLIYFKEKIWKKTAVLFFFLSIGISGLLTNIIKRIVERPRPIHNEAWSDFIHAIEDFEASYSFFSSHSATTFSMAVFFFMFFRNNKLYGYMAIGWASIVAYSRIYLAKHYPFDVFCGILFGTIVGILGYKLFELYIKKKERLEP